MLRLPLSVCIHVIVSNMQPPHDEDLDDDDVVDGEMCARVCMIMIRMEWVK